jgi:hypothetical protein
VPEFERKPAEAYSSLLTRRISEMGLRIEGSPLERFVRQLYKELLRKGLVNFRPVCYLSDEWGCPDGEPVIGIPFYLADPKLAALERDMNDLEDEREIMQYLRHEAGHAFTYAYGLHKTPEWRALFGPFRRRYLDDYRPVPFSKQFVRHIAGWYAQKHPDEDFAETFAVWLTPGSGWRKRYAGWPALRKLRYVDRTARAVRDTKPAVPTGEFDVTVDEMNQTIEEFYREPGRSEVRDAPAALDLALEADLTDLFSRRRRGRKNVRPAAEFVEEHRILLTDKITYWTGVRRPVVRALIERIAKSCGEQDLWSARRREPEVLVELTTYATALAMNYLTRGKFFL